MILEVEININGIILEGKKYNWVRPEKCKKCGHDKLWGHGYVSRYFEFYRGIIWIKRYRCPCCGTVYTMRPKGYWRRFQAKIKTIVKSVKEKLEGKKWLEGINYQRQQYWLKGFRKQCSRSKYKIGEISFKIFLELIKSGKIATTHSMRFFQVYPA